MVSNTTKRLYRFLEAAKGDIRVVNHAIAAAHSSSRTPPTEDQVLTKIEEIMSGAVLCHKKPATHTRAKYTAGKKFRRARAMTRRQKQTA